MPQLPSDTKYKVMDALLALASGEGMEKLLDPELDFNTLEVTRIDRLNFRVRLTPNGGGAPRYIAVKVSEQI